MVKFEYIEPTEEQKNFMRLFRAKFQALYEEIDNSMTDSRDKSLCLTKLEESSFWLNKAITHND